MRTLFRFAVLCGLSSWAHAATYTVTRLDDPPPNGCLSNDCSLREAVIQANATVLADTIVLSSGTYSLSRTCATDTASCLDLDISQPVTIQGTGPTTTAVVNAIANLPGAPIDYGHTRVMELTGGPVVLQQLSLRSGFVAAPAAGTREGGCVVARSVNLTMTDVRVESCALPQVTGGTAQGAGVALLNGTHVFTRVTLTANNAAGQGGGLHQSGGTLTGTSVSVRQNNATSYGGGMHVAGGANVSLGGGSSVYSNGAWQGGGVFVNATQGATFGGSGSGAASRLAVTANQAETEGGGVYVLGVNLFGTVPSITLRNLNVQRNVALQHGGGMAMIANGPSVGPVIVHDSEFAENDANGNGGGLYYAHPQASSEDELLRLSFWDNGAGGRGGAMFVLGATRIAHVSTYENIGVAGGSALSVAAWGDGSGKPSVAFLTAFESLSTALDLNQAISLEASVVTGACVGAWSDLGSNFHLNTSTGCPGEPASAAALGLTFGSYGGGHSAVVGIASSTSVLRDAALNVPGTRDVRRYLRQGLADAGAFEYDGVP